MRPLRVGILGATGMVGQQFMAILHDHPWFRLTRLAASRRSAGQTYAKAVAGRWTQAIPVPAAVADMAVEEVGPPAGWEGEVDLVFAALAMDKERTGALEEAYARREIPVVSANSAHRWTPDVPMIIPEVNPQHLEVIASQRRRLGVRRGFVAVKPNCSIQPYVPALEPLREFGPKRLSVCTYQAVSGAGRTLADWPEMEDNIIPFIGGEEDKSRREPLRIWGHVEQDRIEPATGPLISIQCVRVPVSHGHLAAVAVDFERRPEPEEILQRWESFRGRPQILGLPSAPEPLLRYCPAEDRPQTRLDRDAARGMAVVLGRLRPDELFDYQFIALSHNVARGAAGGAVLTAELLVAEGYLEVA
ncbi:MAG: aspartate-semialdehyde dehydrogenase [Candidatus Latescibacteria bacterium]|nr:aspartate-semialdehyde dehydrogenase [Candidatus Latescibacterota bacterium]